MRARRVFHAVDSHTEGMPTRVIVGGVGVLPGATMAERRMHMIEEGDALRTLLMYEPRGHSAMSGAILQPPTRDDADWGVVYIEVSGCLPMCGHGTIGVATVLVETGMVEVTEPVTTIRLDVPAGLVEARVAVEDGRATSVTIRNVASYVVGLDRVVDVPGIGEVTYDLAFGGNFYAIVPIERLGIPFERTRSSGCSTSPLAMMDAINATDPPVHPLDPGIRECHHVYLEAPGLAPRSTAGTRWRSTRGGSTAPRAARVRRPAWRSCTRAASSRSTPTSSTSPSSAPASPAGSSRRPRSARHPAVIPTSPAAPGSPAPRSTSSTPTTPSPPASSSSFLTRRLPTAFPRTWPDA